MMKGNLAAKSASIYLLRQLGSINGYGRREGNRTKEEHYVSGNAPYRLALTDPTTERCFSSKVYSLSQIENYWGRSKNPIISSKVLGEDAKGNKGYDAKNLMVNIKYIHQLSEAKNTGNPSDFNVRFYRSTIPKTNSDGNMSKFEGVSARIFIKNKNGTKEKIDLVHANNGYICYQPEIMQNLTSSTITFPWVEKANEKLRNFIPERLEEIKSAIGEYASSGKISKKTLQDAYRQLKNGGSVIKVRLKTKIPFNVLGYIKELAKSNHPLSEIYYPTREKNEILADYTLAEIVKTHKNPLLKYMKKNPARRANAKRMESRLNEMKKQAMLSLFDLRREKYGNLINYLQEKLSSKSISNIEKDISMIVGSDALKENMNRLLENYDSDKRVGDKHFIEDVFIALENYAGIAFDTDDSEMNKIRKKKRDMQIASRYKGLIESKRHLALLENGAGDPSEVESAYRSIADSLGIDHNDPDNREKTNRKLVEYIKISRNAIQEAFSNESDNSYGLKLKEIVSELGIPAVHDALSYKQKPVFEHIYSAQIKKEMERFERDIISQAHINTVMSSYAHLKKMPDATITLLSEYLGIRPDDVRKIEDNWIGSRKKYSDKFDEPKKSKDEPQFILL